MGRKPNPKLVKLHRSYTVAEVTDVCGVHRGTVRNWIKSGLETVDDARPTLILGSILRSFLERKRTKDKKKMKPGEIYCVKCREPRYPLDGYADLEVKGDSFLNLVGICPECETVINRRVSLRKLRCSIGKLEVTLPEALEQLEDSDELST